MGKLKSLYSFFSKPIFSYLIFWGWNFVFLILLLNCLVILLETLENVITGFTPLSFSICVLFFLLIPVFSTILGFTVLKNNPKKLLKFFYGIELPLWMLFLMKFSLFRELTIGTTHIFIMLFLGLVGYAIELFSLEAKLPSWYKYVHKLLSAFLLFIGLYVFLIGMFYSFPIILNFLIELFSFEWLSSFNGFDISSFFFFGFLIMLFVFITFPLVILLPVFIVILYTKSFLNNFKNVRIKNLKYLSVAFFVINVIVFVVLNLKQPHQFALKIANRNMLDLKNRKELYWNEEDVKKGLLNSYLNKYRYISSTENNHIEELYKDCLKSDFIAEKAQEAYNFLMSPFLYKGDRDEDIELAKKLYESNFDIGIQKDNKEEIITALSSTWDRDGVEAGVLNVNQEKVLLVSQDITVEEDNNVASIEIHEVYKNKTFDRQEIFYYFTIPPNTVINGLWLSDTDTIAKKYEFKVSPRGAAQQVYKEEVRRRVDPSLLEQVGPYQYRLRAFPILPKIRNYRNKEGLVTEGDNFHLWIRFKTILSSDNDWKMPQLIEKRNIYWDEHSKRTLNGEKIITENWLPKSLKTKGNSSRSTFVEKLNDSIAIEINQKEILSSNHLKDKRVSFLIDGSYSMKKHLDDIQKTLDYFSSEGISAASELNFVSRDFMNTMSFSERDNFLGNNFYGTISNIEVLHRFKKLNKSQDYIIYITDEGGYDKSIDSLKAVDFNVPLIVIHSNNLMPPIYADAFLESVQNSNGFISKSLEAIDNQISVSANSKILSYQDGLMYEKMNSEKVTSNAVKDIVAHAYINNTENKIDNRIQWLDEVHRIAVDNKIVTKFSSMIVLVNEAQKKRLEELENKEDRFDREKENGEESLTNPNDLFEVSAAPEPEEWLLIILIVLYVCYHFYSKKIKIKLN